MPQIANDKISKPFNANNHSWKNHDFITNRSKPKGDGPPNPGICSKVRLWERSRHSEEHANSEAERMEHPDCLQASMGRLDSAESTETGRRKIEGKNEFSTAGVCFE